MPTDLIRFPRILIAANDNGPTGPGGTEASAAEAARQARMVRELCGVRIGQTIGIALAA